MIASSKLCTNCKTEYPATTKWFCVERRLQSGLSSVCRRCKHQANERWRKANLGRANQQRLRWAKEHPESIRKAQQQFKIQHPQRLRSIKERWRLSNKDKVAIKQQRYKARRRSLAATLTISEWIIIIAHWGDACAYCGRPESECGKLAQEHVIPVAQGGGYTADNIVPACKSCNSRKGGRTPEQAGMRLRKIGT